MDASASLLGDEARSGQRVFASTPPFDPEDGTTVREPPGSGSGWWVGCAGILRDHRDGAIYCSYRVRHPADQGRGVETRIARSENGRDFVDVWAATQSDFAGTDSFERSALVQDADGECRLYVSYVDPSDGRWRIDVLTADQIRDLDPARRQPALLAGDVGAFHVKDPYVVRFDGVWHMLLSVHTQSPGLEGPRVSVTALATSVDGFAWDYEGVVFQAPLDAWDTYLTRIDAIVDVGGAFLGFYDGSRDVSDVFEGRTGLAVSRDLRTWHRLTPDGSVLASPHGSGCLRYLDVLPLDNETLYYYEYARPDRSHELRVSAVPVSPPRLPAV